MSCNNFTGFIGDIDLFCGSDINLVKQNCNIVCMTSIMVIMNECLGILKYLELDTELSNIIKWCYYQKVNMLNTEGH